MGQGGAEAKRARRKSPGRTKSLSMPEAPEKDPALAGKSAHAEEAPPASGTLQAVGRLAEMFEKLAAVLSALLLSWPVWLVINMCGPHMPRLFVPMLLAAALRLVLVLCHLVQKALVDGELDRLELLGVLVRFMSEVLVTVHAVLPQPIFITLIGGSFAGGDAARASHMRASRWIWRHTVHVPVEVLLSLAGVIYFCPWVLRAVHEMMPKLWRQSLSEMVPGCLLTLVKTVVISVCWTVFAARMQLLPLTHLLGMDPSSYLAFLVPDELLMFRRELSLYHVFTPNWPWLTASTIGLGDMLMSNPALPGSVGFCGALVVGAVLSLVGQPIQTGYWLAAGAWGMLAFTDYVFEKYDVEHLKFERDASIALGSVAAVELEEDEDSGQGPHTSNASITLKLPGGYGVSFDTPFMVMAAFCAVGAVWVAPYQSFAWLIWGVVWFFYLGSAGSCCLPWLPNDA